MTNLPIYTTETKAEGLTKKQQIDQAYSTVAKKILTESLQLKPGETLTIESWTEGVPFASTVALEAKKLGAFPIVTYEDEENYVSAVRSAPKDSVGKMGRHEYALVSASDAYVFIPGPPIGGYYPKITRKEYIDSTGYNESWYDAAKKSRLRGARLTSGYIGKDIARLLGKKRKDIILHHLNAVSADFAKIQSKAKEIGALMIDGANAKILSNGSELGFTLKGELEIQDGIVDVEDIEKGNNMAYVPAGYVGKDIDPATVDGELTVSPSVTRFGLLKDGRIAFEKGKFHDWESKGSPEVLKDLEKVLTPEARVPSFVMVGLNPKMEFGYAQDRFPEGSITLVPGFNGIVRKGTFEIDGKKVVSKGKISI